MFRIYHSNKLDVLKGILAHLIRQQPLNNPFEQEQILVQSPGMAQWLKLELANEFGICANVKFPLPASFIWQSFVNVLPDVPERSAFNKDAMAWQIIKLLPENLTDEAFNELADYLREDEPLKLYQLAYKIADIFDQYLVYRPQWIEAWQQGDFSCCGEKVWQGKLWQQLFEVITHGGQSHYHRANLYEHLIEALSTPQAVKTLPSRIFVFGISALPPKYLQALQMMAQHIDVHFFLNNPCQHYWGDIVDEKWLLKLAAKERQTLKIDDYSATETTVIKPSFDAYNDLGELSSGNPLLASMGKLGRDNLALLVELEAQEIDAFVPSEQLCLLDYINDDILELRDPSFIPRTAEDIEHNSRRDIANNDDSVVIHSCHSPMREVEVLRDQLLHMLDNDPQLTPKDIVVMMPDVNAYSPYIQAVFSHNHNYIDFSISDRSAAQEHPILLSFLTLMSLTQLRKGASELFALLEVPAIMSRFELTPNALASLKRWIDESGIRQGLGHEGVYTNSWLFGLNRMFKGYSQLECDPLSSSEQTLWQNILAYPESVGMAAEQLGQLSYFVELISRYSTRFNEQQSFEQWRVLIESMVNDFYHSSSENDAELSLIDNALESLAQELSLANYTLPIDHGVLLEHLKTKLDAGSSSQRFLAGKLNFCTLMPMRSIPFKVVCILGMNDGVYPRTIAPIGFDLMANNHQKGDRSRRDDDRYLFLEAMLSAQKKLYLSYCGRSIKDNSERCPSVLVSELIDYIGLSYRLEGDSSPTEQCSKHIKEKLVIEHPLTPFSEQYYNQSEELFSYQQDWLAALDLSASSQDFLVEPLPLELNNDVIEIDKLIRFIKHSTQYFFNQRLGIYFNANDTELTDSEPFDPDALASYDIKGRMLAGFLQDKAQVSQDYIRAQGILPHAHFADLYLTQQSEQMAPLSQQVRPYLHHPLDDVEVDIVLTTNHGPLKLQGWLKDHYAPNTLVRYKSGKANAKLFVQCYIDYLCYCTLPVVANELAPPQMHILAQDGHWTFDQISATDAHSRLTSLTQAYLQGLCAPLPLFIQSGWKYIDSCFDEKSKQLLDDEKSKNKALKAFKTRFDGGFMINGEREDPYIARSLASSSFDELSHDMRTTLITTAVEFLLPVRQLLNMEVDDES